MTAPRLTDCLLQIDGRVALLTLNRDDVRNALTGTRIVNDILLLVEWLNQQSEVQCLVLTGGGRAFCSGGNVKDMAERSNDFAGSPDELAQRYQQGIQRLPLALSELEIPVIAAVNGAAIGAGFDLVNMCDLALAGEKAKFGETFVNLGIIPGDGGAWFLPRKIGPQRAAELALTGRIVEGAEAVSLGLVLELLPQSQLLPRAMQLAQQIASKPSYALRQTKRLLKLSETTALDQFLAICAEVQGQCHHDPEHLQAVNRLLKQMGQG
ncbi:enoyl-CoA hydratase [Motiliproteus coralliicola]|uniref:Enoyl-CoA hydratase n=1 Tax=Motiliproteus coralliicola TaxID=2283196 RepID=A0A369WCA2_9GAMM|nr:enoyl-CoA hydratase-related protein [Motiliproteus coralliicola]RDE19648.1 enoyl-CoA hydratase [Motiliproteus coralliicola]